MFLPHIKLSLTCVTTSIVALLALLLSGTAAANNDARLQSIKQQTLALYTLRLADQRQFSSSATVLIGQLNPSVRLERVRIAVDGELRIDYAYHASESALLAQDAMHRLGLVNLAGGVHELTVEMQWDHQGSKRTQSRSQTLRLDTWPRGFSVQLDVRERGSQQIDIRAPIDGAGILRSARFELALGRALMAVTQMQMLAHVDPVLASTPPAQELLAQSLAAWGLDSAAQATFSKLSQSQADTETRNRARLRAAELALSLGQADTAGERLREGKASWSVNQQAAAQLLDARRLLAQDQIDEALKHVTSSGPALLRYNLAVALIDSGQNNAAERLLQELATEPAARDEFHARIQDLAQLKLGYRHLRAGQAEAAQAMLTRMRLNSPYTNRALLGRGWSKLLPVATNGGRLQSVQQDDGFRPLFVQAIDAALRKPEQSALARVRDAVTDWARLQDQDPFDPAVQEALVATPYALLKMGDYSRAIQYSEKAIARLELIREDLKAGMRQSRKGLSLNGAELVRDAWPPEPAAWARRYATGAWWRSEASPLPIPEGAYRPRLLLDGDTLTILDDMHMLNEVEQLTDAIAEHPDLKLRATQLRKRIESERQAQQKNLDRQAYYWMYQELERATRYLIMARFSLGHAYAYENAMGEQP